MHKFLRMFSRFGASHGCIEEPWLAPKRLVCPKIVSKMPNGVE